MSAEAQLSALSARIRDAQRPATMSDMLGRYLLADEARTAATDAEWDAADDAALAAEQAIIVRLMLELGLTRAELATLGRILT